MVHFLSDSFPPIERRRPIQKILPAESEAPKPTGQYWAMLVSWLVISLTLTGAQTYRAYFRDADHPTVPTQGTAHYRWHGFHRVAP